MTERHTHTHTHTLSESHHTFPAGHFTRRSATSFKKQRLNKIFNCGESGREWSGPDWTQTADITPRAETKFNVTQQLSNCCWRASTLDLILTNTPWAGDACLGAWGVPSTPRLSVQTSRNFHSNLTICPVWACSSSWRIRDDILITWRHDTSRDRSRSLLAGFTRFTIPSLACLDQYVRSANSRPTIKLW